MSELREGVKVLQRLPIPCRSKEETKKKDLEGNLSAFRLHTQPPTQTRKVTERKRREPKQTGCSFLTRQREGKQSGKKKEKRGEDQFPVFSRVKELPAPPISGLEASLPRNFILCLSRKRENGCQVRLCGQKERRDQKPPQPCQRIRTSV